MTITRAQIDRALDLIERAVEAHETIAHAAVILTTPNVITGDGVPMTPTLGGLDTRGTKPQIDEPAQGGTESISTPESSPELDIPIGESQSVDPLAVAGSADKTPEDDFLDGPTSDTPSLDLTNKKDVDEFRATLGNLLREFGKVVGSDMALDLIEEVTGTKKFSECPPDKLEELHDAVYDALAEAEG